ncbi:hypothetical protein TSAR_016816 [Trichomalopsis sarcophagae]|uniref:BTB domain-containing protein n=1 Tax=Trichomalopsis sarcophagae TaxID=543379 RepID=A0A232EQ77_9HYME|nr:hypothetical protein TSAR_016816 [Trichomalopsis sarcophagae]
MDRWSNKVLRGIVTATKDALHQTKQERDGGAAAAPRKESTDESVTLHLDSSSDDSRDEIIFLGQVLKKPAADSVGTTGQIYGILMAQDSLGEKWEGEKDQLLIEFLIQNLKKIQAYGSVSKVLQESDSILRRLMPESLIRRIRYLADAPQYVRLIRICGGDKLKNEEEKYEFLERLEHLRKFMSGIVDGRCLKAHRFVLAAAIPYFEKMFTGDSKEQRDEALIVKNVEARNLETLLLFAYTGQVELSERNADSLMLDADFLGLRDVADECARFLESRISVENALQEKSSKYLLRRFPSFEKTEQFLQISLEDLAEIMSSDGLQLASEEHVYAAMMRWLKHDLAARGEHLPRLLGCVRLPYLSAEYLVKDVLEDELIAASEECKSLVNGVIYSRIILKEQSLMNDVKARDCELQAGQSGNRIVIHSRSNLSLMEMYHPVTGTWESFTSNKKGSMFLSSAVLKGQLYTVGGEVSVPSSIDVYQPRANSWREICKMKTQRNFPRAVALADFLFICGGHDGKNYLNLVDRYCPETDEWKTMAPMNYNRYSFGAVACQGRIYLCGGYNESAYLTSIECYDPSSDTWTILNATMKENRYYFGMSVLNNKIYICGGRSTDAAALNTVEVYDPKLNTCEYVASMNTPRRGLMLVTYMGKLWAIGGFDGMDALSSVELYEPETNTWSYGASLSGTRPWICGGVIPIH